MLDRAKTVSSLRANLPLWMCIHSNFSGDSGQTAARRQFAIFLASFELSILYDSVKTFTRLARRCCKRWSSCPLTFASQIPFQELRMVLQARSFSIQSFQPSMLKSDMTAISVCLMVRSSTIEKKSSKYHVHTSRRSFVTENGYRCNQTKGQNFLFEDFRASGLWTTHYQIGVVFMCMLT